MIDDAILETLKLTFSSATQRINIPSLDGVYVFREPSVKEVKSISKSVLSDVNSLSNVYASSLALIKLLSVDNIDVKTINEIERLKILVQLFSSIFFSKNFNIRCPKKVCDNIMPYSIKYGDILSGLDSIDMSDIIFENETECGKIKITCNFPSCRRYLDMLCFINETKPLTDDDYRKLNDTFIELEKVKPTSIDDDFIEKIKKRREILANDINKNNIIVGNIDMKSMGVIKSNVIDISDIYIKNIFITNIPNNPDEVNIDFDNFDYVDTVKILDMLPAKFFTSDKFGDFKKYLNWELQKKFAVATPKIVCDRCGFEISKRLGLQNFFMHG